MMNTTAKAAILTFVILAAALTEATAQLANTEFAAINEIRSVRLADPTPFWRNGKQFSSADLLVFRVRLTDPSEFVPRGITPPLFVYGDTVCQVIREPFPSGEAILLAPRIPGPALLWLTETGVLAQELSPSETQRLWQKAESAAKLRAVKIPATPAASGPATFKDLGELFQNLQAGPAP